MDEQEIIWRDGARKFLKSQSFEYFGYSESYLSEAYGYGDWVVFIRNKEYWSIKNIETCQANFGKGLNTLTENVLRYLERYTPDGT